MCDILFSFFFQIITKCAKKYETNRKEPGRRWANRTAGAAAGGAAGAAAARGMSIGAARGGPAAPGRSQCTGLADGSEMAAGRMSPVFLLPSPKHDRGLGAKAGGGDKIV